MKFKIIGHYPPFKRTKDARLRILFAAKALPPTVKDYKYLNKKSRMVFNFKDGYYRCDCSSMVETVLHFAVPTNYFFLNKNLCRKRENGSMKRIYARMFAEYSLFLESPNHFSSYWSPIRYVRNVKAGDIYAVKYPPSHRSTGHVMIVTRTPKKLHKADIFKAGVEGVMSYFKGGDRIYSSRIIHSYKGGLTQSKILFVSAKNGRAIGHIRNDQNDLRSYSLMKFLRAKT